MSSLKNPSRDYTVMPFWFWNDNLDEKEILRQIDDFEKHGVYGFVIHPRVGLPSELSWMSEKLLHFYHAAINEASRRGFRVSLYDEGMYPSGSSSGQVVAENPAYACRCLAKIDLPDNKVPILKDGENLIALVQRQNGGFIAVIDRPAKSHIRGLHYIGDGPEEEHPAAADLLNPDAVAIFIRLVYDKFAEYFGEYFGKTIVSIFTDEPGLLGKCKERDVFPGTTGILQQVSRTLGYDFTDHLPALWYDDEPNAIHFRQDYLYAVNICLQKTYYTPLYRWCKQHRIALTGHPKRPDDIEILRYFQIPGQDSVWRQVLPDHPSALEGAESTQAKCTASVMLHTGRRRNANECYGAYGHELSWDEMIWLAHWLFVRGVNLLYPHAFYYSVRGVRCDERPPDVGPHNTWWERYSEYALACRRLAWLNTDSIQVCSIAVLGKANYLPWHAAKICFQNQRDFNYLTERDILELAVVDTSGIHIVGVCYSVLIVEHDPSTAVMEILASLSQSGRLIRYRDDMPDLDLIRKLDELVPEDIKVSPPSKALRIRHVIKENRHYYILFNEEKASVNVTINIAVKGKRFLFDPYSGTTTSFGYEEALQLSGYEAIVMQVREETVFALPFERTVAWLFPLTTINDTSLLIFSACDSNYLGYAISLIRSLDVFSPGFQFLLHIVNPTETDMGRLKQLSLELVATRLSVSFEYSDLSGLTPDQQRTYYACTRFLRLAELLPEISIPVLCLDTDSLIVNPIDFDFSNKEHAHVCLVRRDLHSQVSDSLAVANGSIWLAATVGAQKLITNVAQDIVNAFADGSAAWYLDQTVMGRQIKSPEIRGNVFNINKQYADWDFRDTGIIWAGKGDRKHMDMRFFLLQRMLSDDIRLQSQALQIYLQNFAELTGMEKLRCKLDKVKNTTKGRVVVFLPRLDLPWKEPKDINVIPPVLAEDTLSLRLHWKEFTIRMANAIERVGIKVDVVELPAWQITESQVKASGAQLALIPHRCKHDFNISEFPVLFYMQEYFRWVFVVDKEGWGAASSVYPVPLVDELPNTDNPGAFEVYRRRLRTGGIDSKFAQTARVSKQDLLDSGQIPDRPYIFFPLQIPHDQVIRYFSDLSEQDVLESLLLWSERRGVSVVLKPHPANPKSMEIFAAMSKQSNVYWSNAHIYDLIEHATGVYTINSGVGFEALLQLKPVITFGRAEYDCVTFNASLDQLDEAWRYAVQASPKRLEASYCRFIDWFLSDYAVDLSLPCQAKSRLDKIAVDIAKKLLGSVF